MTPHEKSNQSDSGVIPSELIAAVDALAGPFDQWLADNVVPAEFAQLREPLLTGVAAMAQVGGTSLTAWRPEILSETLDLIEPELAPEEHATLVSTLGLALGFLIDTGRWQGSLEEADGCLELLDDLEDQELFEILTEVAGQVPPIEEEIAALTQLPQVGAGLEVIRWLGSGRAVTPAGNVRLADLSEAAAALGLNVRVTKDPPPLDQDAFDLALELPFDPTARHVRGMDDVPELASTWESLSASGWMDRPGGRMLPTTLGQSALGSDPQARVVALRAFAVSCLRAPFDEFASQPVIGLIGPLLVSLLGASCRDVPVPHEMWDAVITEALDAMFGGPTVDFDDEDEDEDGYEDEEPDSDLEFTESFKALVHDRVRQIELQGFLTEDPEGYIVPAPLRALVAQTLLDILDER